MASKRILMLVYTLDLKHPFLSSQARLVTAISRRVASLHVITGSVGNFEPPANIRIYELDSPKTHTRSKSISRLLKLFSLIKSSRKIIRESKVDTIFVHMADLYAAALSCFCFFDSRRIFLWYAHAYPSFWLKICRLRNVSFLTSTKGSFPFQKSQVQILGQIVDESLFPFNSEQQPIGKLGNVNFCHVGRLDKSKNVHYILLALAEIKAKNEIAMSFNHFGEAAQYDDDYVQYLDHQIAKIQLASRISVKINPSVVNTEVAGIFKGHDVFIHAFQGSLDKTLIEATLAGIPVITANREYIRLFGSWSPDVTAECQLSINEILTREWLGLASMDSNTFFTVIRERSTLARLRFTEEPWLENFFAAIKHREEK